jgi:hypothetical protein
MAYGQWFAITAKFAGTCRRCKQGFAAGEKIQYNKQYGTYHPKSVCPGKPQVETQEQEQASA